MQNELFDIATPATSPETESAPKSSILEKHLLSLRVDQTIGIVLVLMVFYVLSFSFGFEKGKHSIQNSQVVKAAPAPVAQELPANLTIVEEAPAVPVKAAEAPSEKARMNKGASASLKEPAGPETPAKGKPAGKYTIQHVIYRTKSAAEREIQSLTKKGQAAFIIPSGKYLQVCIAGFQTKKEADSYMKQLRTQRVISGDAYVRAIPA